MTHPTASAHAQKNHYEQLNTVNHGIRKIQAVIAMISVLLERSIDATQKLEYDEAYGAVLVLRQAESDLDPLHDTIEKTAWALRDPEEDGAA